MARGAYKVSYLRAAEIELAEIRGYAMAVSSVSYASRLYLKLVGLGNGLTLFPHRHEAIPLLPEDPRVIRRLLYQTYMIIYRVDDKSEEVVNLGVFATRRDLAGLEVILGRG